MVETCQACVKPWVQARVTHTKRTLIYLAISTDTGSSHVTLGLLRSYQSKRLLYKSKEACMFLDVLAKGRPNCPQAQEGPKAPRGDWVLGRQEDLPFSI